jgi:hypothetical protein
VRAGAAVRRRAAGRGGAGATVAIRKLAFASVSAPTAVSHVVREVHAGRTAALEALRFAEFVARSSARAAASARGSTATHARATASARAGTATACTARASSSRRTSARRSPPARRAGVSGARIVTVVGVRAFATATGEGSTGQEQHTDGGSVPRRPTHAASLPWLTQLKVSRRQSEEAQGRTIRGVSSG